MKIRNCLPMLAIAALVAFPAFAGDGAAEGKGARHQAKFEKKFEKMDADGNGAVSRDEFLAGHITRFEKMDSDGDGSLTTAEMEAAREAMKTRWKEKRGAGDTAADPAPEDAPEAGEETPAE